MPLGYLRFLFGDKRSVPPNHDDSNYALAMRTLLLHGFPSSCEITRLEPECSDWDAAAKRYEKLIPEKVDLLLLGIDMDWYVASLFPYDATLQPGSRSVLPVTRSTSPRERRTISPR